MSVPLPPQTSSTESPTPASRPRSTRRKLAIGFGVVFALYLFAGFVVVPRVVESQIVSILEAQAGVTPKLENVSFDPLEFRLVIRGFELPDPSRAGSLVEFEELVVDLRPLGFFSADVALEDFLLVGPRVSLVIDESGELNLLTLLASMEDDEPFEAETSVEAEGGEDSEGLLIVDVDSIRIERGAVIFLDRSHEPAFDVNVEPLDFAIEEFTTRAGGSSPYRLEIRVGDETELVWSGTLGLDPIRSEGEIELTRFDLRMPWDYASDRLRFEVSQGALNVAARYALDLSEGPAFSLSEARLELSDVEILDRTDREPVIALPSLSVTGIEVAADSTGLQSLSIADVSIEGGRLGTRLEPDGSVHLLSLSMPVARASEQPASDRDGDHPAASPTETDAKAVTPEIRVDRIGVAGFEIDIEDRGPVRSVPLRMAPLTLEILGFRTAPGTELTIRFSSGFGEAGQIALSGPLTLDPLAIQLAIEATAIALEDLQPYLEGIARFDIPKGTVSTRLDLDIRDGGGEAPRVAARGRIQIDDLRTTARLGSGEFLDWDRLRVEAFDFAPERLRIAEVALSGAHARVVLDANGSSNLAAIFGAGDGAQGEGESGVPVEVEVESAADPLSIEIAKITLDGVRADFADLSATPNFRISLDDLQGTVEGLSSEGAAPAEVKIAGRVDQTSAMRVEGQVNPLARHASMDLGIVVDAISLPAFTPYSERFVGYSISNGSLGLDLHYKLNAGHLEAQNRLVLRKFAFGDRVESETATSLPVSLAVAVLTDSAGNIQIALPIEGDVDDPSFNVLGLLGRALVDVVTNVAAAPFGALAGLVGGSGADLARVAFDSGSVELVDAEEDELTGLAALLARQPDLRLEIRGRADPDVDGPGLRLARVDEAVRLAAFESYSRQRRKEIGDPSAVVLAPEEQLDQLERLVGDRIGGRVRDLLTVPATEADANFSTEALIEAARAALAAQVEVAEMDWRKLAEERADSIQSSLLATELIQAERVSMLDVEVGTVAVDGVVLAELSLRAD